MVRVRVRGRVGVRARLRVRVRARVRGWAHLAGVAVGATAGHGGRVDGTVGHAYLGCLDRGRTLSLIRGC